MTDRTVSASDVSWDDACWEMIMECEEHETLEYGFKTPSAELVAKYCKIYPQHAEYFIDFVATAEFMERWAKLHPAPEPTEAEIARGVKKAIEAFRGALRKARKRKTARDD